MSSKAPKHCGTRSTQANKLACRSVIFCKRQLLAMEFKMSEIETDRNTPTPSRSLAQEHYNV